MTVEDIITSVRRYIGQIPLDVESVSTDTQTSGSVSTLFSDADLISRINSAINQIVKLCKAMDFPSLISAYTGSLSSVLTSNERIIEGRVQRHNGTTYINALSIDPMEYRSMTTSGRTPTSSYPVFSFADGTLTIYPTPTTGHRVYVVAKPTELVTTSDTIPMDERFRRAIVLYVAASCFATMKRTEESKYISSAFEDEIYPYAKNIIYNPKDGIESRSE